MTSISKPDTVVDDFLSSLSQLSQDRLREDQQRQRDLQRNINVLKSRSNSNSPVKRVGKSDLTSFSSSFSESGISSLKFNRNLSYINVRNEVNAEDVGDIVEGDDSGPELRRRRYLTDEGPTYPSRPNLDEARNNPILPARKDVSGKKIPPSKPSKNLLQLKSDSFDIDLLQPTIRISDNIIANKEVLVEKDYNKPNGTNANSGGKDISNNKEKSFFDIENDIKSSSISNTFDSRVESLIAKAGCKHTSNDCTSKSYKLPPRPKINSKPLYMKEKTSESNPSQSGESENNDGTNLLKAKPKPDWLTSSDSNFKTTNIQSANHQTSPSSNSSSMYQQPYKPAPKPKSDWLSSTLSNNKTTSTQQDGTRNFVIPKKGEYSNHGANNNREIHDNSGGNISYSPTKPKQTDWMTSLYKNSTTTTTKLPPTTSKPAYLSSSNAAKVTNPTNRFNNDISSQDTSPTKLQSNKKPTSWIDSALKKSDSGNKFDDLKPSYQIPIKSKVPIIEETAEEPELFAKFKDRSSSPQKPPIIPPKLPNKIHSQEEPTAEYLTKLRAITNNKDSKKPIKPSKPPIEQYVKQEQDILSQTKLKLGTKPNVPKFSKPSLNKYKTDDELVLKSTMRSLSPNKITKVPTTIYLEKDAEELRNQMTRLSTSPSKYSQPNVKRYESQDTEELKSQLNKLGSKKPTYNMINKSEEEIEGLTALTKLKPTKPTKPTMLNKDQLKESIELKSSEPDAVDFKSQLSSILKVGSGPLTPRHSDNDIGMKNISYSQSTKDNKLTHHNKSRAKGPKRRLPKKGSSKDSSTPSTSTPSTSTSTRKPYINKSNKPKPEIKVKPRVFSGEVFI